eukprot:6113492-Pleurochrysis_carterae.AAC.2
MACEAAVSALLPSCQNQSLPTQIRANAHNRILSHVSPWHVTAAAHRRVILGSPSLQSIVCGQLSGRTEGALADGAGARRRALRAFARDGQVVARTSRARAVLCGVVVTGSLAESASTCRATRPAWAMGIVVVLTKLKVIGGALQRSCMAGARVAVWIDLD